jgi:hypothetical protein
MLGRTWYEYENLCLPAPFVLLLPMLRVLVSRKSYRCVCSLVIYLKTKTSQRANANFCRHLIISNTFCFCGDSKVDNPRLSLFGSISLLGLGVRLASVEFPHLYICRRLDLHFLNKLNNYILTSIGDRGTIYDLAPTLQYIY